MTKIPSPSDETTLLNRANDIAGQSLKEIASFVGLKTPDNLLHHKGWIGQLIERVLGCTAGSKPEPDFPHLGIELKTIPISSTGQPKESTFVCVTPLKHLAGLNWENSVVFSKLKKVLWIPVEADPNIPLAQRRLGMPLLWQPNKQTLVRLKTDFDEHIERISLGNVEDISAKDGEILQIRPKAANARQLTEAIGKSGELFLTLPRGFYLRPGFTRQILEENYC